MVISSFYRLQFISFVSCTLIFFSLQQVQLLGFYSLSVSLYTLFFSQSPTLHYSSVGCCSRRHSPFEVAQSSYYFCQFVLCAQFFFFFFFNVHTSFFRFLFSFFYCSYLLFHVVHSIMVLFAWHKSPRFGS